MKTFLLLLLAAAIYSTAANAGWAEDQQAQRDANAAYMQRQQTIDIQRRQAVAVEEIAAQQRAQAIKDEIDARVLKGELGHYGKYGRYHLDTPENNGE